MPGYRGRGMYRRRDEVDLEYSLTMPVRGA